MSQRSQKIKRVFQSGLRGMNLLNVLIYKLSLFLTNILCQIFLKMVPKNVWLLTFSDAPIYFRNNRKSVRQISFFIAVIASGE